MASLPLDLPYWLGGDPMSLILVRVIPAGAPAGTPAVGISAGRSLVEIYGGGFRLPPAVPVSGPTGDVVGSGLVRSEVQQTVSVTFGGAAALSVEVVRSNLLRVVTPETPLDGTSAENYGEGDVDVVVTNLDDSGDPIPGQSATLADGYRYVRPRLGVETESDFTRLVRGVVRQLKRQIVPEVVLTQSPDWDPDATTQSVEVATTPALAVSFRVRTNRFYSLNAPQDVKISDDRVELRRRPKTVDVVFTLVGIADAYAELLNLFSAAQSYLERNPFFYLDRSAADPSLGTVRYELAEQDEFQIGNRPSPSNVHSFSGSFVIRGVDIEAFAGFVSDELASLTRTVETDPILDVQALDE